MTKKYLLIGGAGYIGRFLARRLIAENQSVYIMVKESTDLSGLADILGLISVITCDLKDEEKLKMNLRQIAPDYIFNLVRYGPSCDEQLMRSVNVLTLNSILKAIIDYDFETFVHVGSSLEYGPKQGPMHETSSLEPTTAFGAIKADATRLCQRIATKYNKPIVILRPFLIYGPNDRFKRFIPTAIRAIQKEEILFITNSKFKRDWVFIEDVVDAFIAAVNKKLPPGEVYNIGSGKQYSNIEIVSMLEKICQKKIRLDCKEYPKREFDSTCWVSDISKAKKELGWEPRLSLYEGLKQTVSRQYE